MSIQSGTIQPIPLQNLLIDLRNPRYDPRSSQRDALTKIAHDQAEKLINLAQDILDKGLNRSDIPMVTPEGDIFIVLEGNRRVAALKLMSSPALIESLGLPQKLTKKFKELCDNAKDRLPTTIECVVTTREDANYWIQLKHTGENEGVGVVSWDGAASHRFRGNSPALQAIELVEKSEYIDQETRNKLEKIPITNIERILGTPDARDLLGVEVNNQQLTLKRPEDEALARLSIVISDIANRRKKVTDLDTWQQRVDYAQEVASRPLPKPYKPSTTPSEPSQEEKGARRVAAGRKTLIPHQLKLVIPHTRINKIYFELQNLNVEKFINSCAVMFRVFVEMSVDDFAQRHKTQFTVPIKSKSSHGSKPKMVEMTLRQKLTTIADYLEKQGACNKHELHGVRSLVANRYHVLSVDSLHAYVHNKEYSPTPSDLKGNWDSIQVFVQKLWAV
jgi:hypothetical protein